MTEEKNTTPLHGSNVAREQIPAACKWHVSDIYAGENDWQAACEEYKSKLPQLQAMQGQLNTAAAVCAALKLQEELAKLLDKIYAYARLQQDADNTDQKLQALAGEAEGMAAAFSNANAFVEPEMLALGKEKLLQMLDEEPALAEYRFYIENMVRLSDHVLSADKEAVFAQSHLATGTAAAAFRALVSADMQFPEFTDGQGNKTSVSEGCYLLNMTSPDRVLRKNSFTGLMNTYHQYRNTLAATLTGSARTGYFYATVHNYKDTLEAALAEDNIPSSLYDGLIDTVHDNFAPLHEYIQLKKDVLGVDEFHYYDMYMPISNAGDSFACSFPEACAKVEEALAPLGKEYLTALHKGMTEGWIDVYENKGKRSGAYSWGVYGVHPFVLLNYQPRYNSISTIAHEIRNPLTLVSSALQVMEIQHPEVKDFSHWSQMHEDVDFMCSLLNELSSFNNSDSLHYSVFSIGQLLKNIAVSFAISLDEHDNHIEFSSDIAPDLHDFTGDKIKLEEVLLNILKNAQEAIPTDTLHGSIHMKAEQIADMLIIKITDNGCGISADHLESIFEPFTTYKQNGTGLGLSLSKRIIEAHGGTISVNSVPGKETLFTLRLPM